MQANKTLLQMKYARVVEMFAEQENIPAEQALDFFYHSRTYQELHDGVADLHCRSDQYVVDELKLEFNSRQS